MWHKKVDTSNSRKRNKITRVGKVHRMAQERENRRLKEENEFLAEASFISSIHFLKGVGR